MKPTAAQLLQVDRLWRFITQAVKKRNIRGYHGLYPFLSAMKKLCLSRIELKWQNV